MAVVTDGHLGLSTALRTQLARPLQVAIPAVTVPLRKAATRGGAQDLYAHPPILQFCVGVRVDFAVEANLFELRGAPFHGLSPLGLTSLIRYRCGLASFSATNPKIATKFNAQP